MATKAPDEDDEIAIALKTVAEHFDKEDLAVRQIQIRYWKRLKYYWNNFSQVWWSGAENTFKVWGRDNFDSTGTTDQAYYDRPVNVFKAFLETIIAALSVQIPVISCAPDDADNPLDISTAKAGNMISQQLYKHNNAIFLWLQALYVYCTEGLIACYTYVDEDEKYGTYKEKKYKDEEVEGFFCPVCHGELDEELLIQAKLIQQAEADEFNPKDDDVALEAAEDSSKPNEIVCPTCASALDPSLAKSKLVIPRFVGYTTKPKSRICMEVYGGLYVKVANYAKKQCDTPYLNFKYETHYVNALECYPELRDKIPQGGWASQGLSDPYEQYARLNIQYRGTIPEENVTVTNSWLRPAAFLTQSKEMADKLRQKFPNGAKVVLVNDIVAEYCAESLDDHWTLTQNPMSDYLNHEPLGEVLTNIQDIVNDLISLTLQTIEHGIAQTWVDPTVVNVDAYGQVEAAPGSITPVKTGGGNKAISDSFYTGQTASLSPEVLSFYQIINTLGQFVSGALPSLFGGAQQGAGDTASEYSMSRSSAQQRLQTPWKMLTIWWKGIFGKAIPMYIQLMVEDERIVRKDEQGNFLNVFIRKAEAQGSIGEIELENADKLPLTDEEQKDIIMQLMALNNSEVFSALSSPENLPFIRKIVRIPQFRLPGEDDRQKAYEEINELVNSVPIPKIPDQMAIMQARFAGQPIEQLLNQKETSVPIDPIIDNHQIEAEICRGWLVSEAGRLTKKENPDGYENVLLHMKAHIDEMNKQMQIHQMQQSMINDKETTPGQPKGQKQKGPEKMKQGEKNVPIS
jgi:hypothetical protein